ncbi:hypothetical protein ScPMuIL_006209 [Solemya velum]
MDAPMKRPHENISTENRSSLDNKKSKSNSKGANNIDNFLNWCEHNNFSLISKVRVGTDGSCAQYGMMATEDIAMGECLFKIPRQHLLTPHTSSLDQTLKTELLCLESGSGWVPLLVSLMYEYTKPTSKWRPYFDLVPNFAELDLPMLWDESDRERLLQGTGVKQAVETDVTSLTKEFEELVLPFLRKHRDHFDDRCKDIEFYKQMVAFVMAYSFTEPSGQDYRLSQGDEPTVPTYPMMVPMADILNHISKNNAHLKFEKDALEMIAMKAIKKGDEVYNTYGELTNWHLLHMYGFSEPYPENIFDTVSHTLEIITKQTQTSLLVVEGILTEEEFYETLKVLAMDRAKFEEHREKEGWSDAEDEQEEDSMNFDEIPKLPNTWKELLKKSAECCLQKYNTSLEDDRKRLRDDQTSISAREKYSLYTAYGQKMLLQQLIECCS